LNITHEPLKDWISIMFMAKIDYSPLHGLSLSILDIEPSFTLGELEKEKQETLKRLGNEGIIDDNKNLKLPLLAQRIAIISVETSKGYADFIDVIDNNSWNYKFFHMLFPSLLQGDSAVQSIIGQLNQIRKVQHHFDLVAIIRGGGGDVGLSCYNNYALSKEVALFPLPVLSGIGHSTNQTVVEMISHNNSITPTKLAELLIQLFHNFSVPLKENEKIIIQKSKTLIEDNGRELQEGIKYFQSLSKGMISENNSRLAATKINLLHGSEMAFVKANEQLISLKNCLSNDSKIVLQKHRDSFREKLLDFDRSSRKTTQYSFLKLSELANTIKKMPQGILKNKKEELARERQEFSKILNSFIDKERLGLTDKKNQLSLLDPINVLERGYSISYLNGKALHHSNDIKKGDVIETRLFNGKLESVVRTSNLIKWKKKNPIQKHSRNFKK